MSPGKSTLKTNTALTIECGKRTAWLHGEGIPRLLRQARITRKAWDANKRCWSIPIALIWDILPVAEKAQRREVNLVEVDR